MKIDILKKLITAINKSLFYVTIFSLWALFQYYKGNIGYIFIFLVFFIILRIWRRAYFTLVIVSVLAIVAFYKPMLDTWSYLRASNSHAIKNPQQVLTNLFKPNSGQEILPTQVQQMLSLLETNHISSYQLSNRLNSDKLIRQRITEAAWPIKKDPKAYYLFKYPNEIIDQQSCTMVDQREEITLDHCY